MKVPMFALSALGASLVLLTSAPAFAATTGMAADSASATPKGEKTTPNQDKATRPAMSGTSRSEVKQETRAAERAGTTLPAGENVTQIPGQKQVKRSKTSENSRAEVKSEAKMAENNGTAVPAGEATSKQQQKGQKQ